MAGKYGPADVTLTIEDGPGGTARNIENYVLSGLAVKIASLMTETTALGDSWQEHTPVGIRFMDPITLEMIWDTTASTGTHAIFLAVDDGPQDDTREVVAVFGDSKTLTFDVRLVSQEVSASTDGVQTISVELQPSGAAVWS